MLKQVKRLSQCLHLGGGARQAGFSIPQAADFHVWCAESFRRSAFPGILKPSCLEPTAMFTDLTFSSDA